MKSFSSFIKESYESTHPINYQGVSDVQTVIGGSENTIKLFAYIIEVCNNMKKQKKFQEQIELNWSNEIAIEDLTEEEPEFFGIISPNGKIYQTSGSSKHRMAICELEDDFEASPEKILKYIKLYFFRGGDLDIRGTKEMISKHMDILKRIADNLGTRLDSILDESKSLNIWYHGRDGAPKFSKGYVGWFTKDLYVAKGFGEDIYQANIITKKTANDQDVLDAANKVGAIKKAAKIYDEKYLVYPNLFLPQWGHDEEENYTFDVLKELQKRGFDSALIHDDMQISGERSMALAVFYPQQIKNIKRLRESMNESKSLIPLALITALGLTVADLKPVDAAKNNPGNIRKSSIKWDGLEDEQTDKHFAEFKSIEYGIRALAKNLKTYRVNYDLNTIEGIVNRWAPPSENPTSKYIKNVSTWMNVKADEPLNIFDTAGNLENRECLKLLIKAIIRQETGKKIDDKLVDKGIDLL